MSKEYYAYEISIDGKLIAAIDHPKIAYSNLICTHTTSRDAIVLVSRDVVHVECKHYITVTAETITVPKITNAILNLEL